MVTINDLKAQAKKLRYAFPEKDINIIIDAGKPRIVVDDAGEM